jgi:predicted outer membrane repeat protein
MTIRRQHEGNPIDAVSALTCAAVASVFILIGTAAEAALTVCGPVGAGTIWSRADSPVSITCDLIVAELTVEAGVQVVVAGTYQIVVDGILRSLGTRELPVIFEPAPGNVSGWRGFLFQDVIDGSIFRWSRIEGATNSAVRLVRSTPVFDHVTFRNNSATRGGAIYAELANRDLTFTHSHFANNRAVTQGGAIYATGPTGPGAGTLVVTDSLFARNIAGTTAPTGTQHAFGGGIYVTGNSRIARSTFTENEAQAYTIFIAGGRVARGGAIYSTSGRTEIDATTFARNACRMGAHFQTPDASRPYGGAAYLASGEMVLRNSLIVENTLASFRNPDHRAGGLYVEGGIATIVNSTIASNALQGVYRGGGAVTIRNSILFFNDSSGVQIAGTVTATYSDIQNGFPGAGNIALNPVFDDRYRIRPPSPAIDAGDPAPEFNDILPIGLGSVRNDMGLLGGPSAVFSAIPDAGADRQVPQRTVVTIDGSRSVALDGGQFTFSWRQAAGPPVSPSALNAAHVVFVAPEVTAPTVLSFELVLETGSTLSVPDTVDVAVADDPSSPPFTDSVLTPAVSVIRSVHFMELRARIDALRIARQLTPFPWTDHPLVVGQTPVSAVHMQELRTALGQAYLAAGRAAPPYTDPELTSATPIRVNHIWELRGFVVGLE